MLLLCRVGKFWWEYLCHDEDDYARRNACGRLQCELEVMYTIVWQLLQVSPLSFLLIQVACIVGTVWYHRKCLAWSEMLMDRQRQSENIVNKKHVLWNVVAALLLSHHRLPRPPISYIMREFWQCVHKLNCDVIVPNKLYAVTMHASWVIWWDIMAAYNITLWYQMV